MWTKEEIGQVIKESRLSAGLTQKQVAEALERPQQTIASWETGKSQPDANTLFVLFQVLGRSVDEAFGFSDNTKKSPSATEAAPGEEELKLMEYLKRAVYDMGFLPEGADLTDRQVEALLGVCAILHAIFDK